MAASRLQSQKDRCLEAVGVLVIVDQDVVEASGDLLGHPTFRHHVRPIEKQVVIVEHVLALLRLDVSREQSAQFCFPFGAPGEVSV